jgi:hypothetical protein
MVGNNRGPFGSQCTNCGFLGCRELGVWCVSILNLEYGGWQVCIQDGDKSPTKPVCHKICHCQSRYWTLWKGSVYHKTCSSELCDFLSLRSISYSFSSCSLFHFISQYLQFFPSLRIWYKVCNLKITISCIFIFWQHTRRLT